MSSTKPAYYHLKKWEIIIDIQCTVLLIFVVIWFGIMLIVQGVESMETKEFFQSIGINVLSSVLVSITLSVFIYFKFLKRIPEENKKKIEELLNARLGYETTNHNAVLQAVTEGLNPNNANLRHEMSKEHDEIKSNLMYLRDLAIREEGKRSRMNPEQINLDTIVEQISGLIDKNSILTSQVETLKVQNTMLQTQNNELRAEIQNTNQQNRSHEPDFEM